MLRKKILVIIAALAACLFFYLLALDSYCDEGERFALGICSITRFVPW
ncbi:PhoP/PhoQ regulator MgrB [Serratia plymuthica]|uniref:PhoP regulon feedback inhibition membrane protein MgrB n=1 Tax=Serratia plymuthica TaxID=82996 RepID=A0A318P773_SERPL|nr:MULTISPECIES: PhoP/PhoQ regulator MgrB [Serratia]EKF64020.1 mgrB family protein [Serratia plymuthica A30]MBI6140930.1 PhoP/PhoQ regulator MgrB [Serratia plymuthica]MBJ7889361.1 PhoP/PhoQ regulator MgrB [Serratia sp. PAMC26656]MBL3523331.1 PhoP/PhoQ regulator MgrB [Serratia plymuthica]MEB6538595.1 PhoP/PhoQ regulator MgrB [Serratia plymuthica]